MAIEDANRKYGYGDHGYIGDDGNYYPFPDNDRLKNIGIDHQTLIPKSKPKTKRKRRPMVEQVAIARGIIKVQSIDPDRSRSRPNPRACPQ
jgi:hypothetical protein